MATYFEVPEFMYVEPRMYVELYGPCYARAISPKFYVVTARGRVRVLAVVLPSSAGIAVVVLP